MKKIDKKCWWKCRENGILTSGRNVQWFNHFRWEQDRELIKGSLLYGLAIQLGIYSREIKIYVHTKTYTWIFIASIIRVKR